ncbi:hypothetical protein QHH11_08580 [Aphanizomenon sp. PH219]|jgi:hypothetical protein|uniref:Type I restriction enzyme R protein N-terminal domain-containing protein n=2 Tax=Dolichospermum TaxID=748770 RepID=A0ABY5LQN1_9CYAN|nr:MULTISPECIES: hypothetical protein [Aphanizomenonaceae]MDK2411521.1 hypothetical protein [Aphanizomenon sp. 202]MDK2459193.1 hypothetical protein [Aphanizomenon sp. PH219]UUO14283.1 hypothetical protein NG743_19890 [Dolichospermum heterosporum TAC447]
MGKTPIIDSNQSYTFADYFKLNYEPDEIIEYFGYSFQSQSLTLPTTQQNLERLTDLKNRIEESLPYISLTSETARREFLIAPVIMELIHYTHAKVKVEYGLNINNQLKGVVDYYIKADNQLLVIEAKNADLERGIVQLAVELIAFDNWSIIDHPILYGAVSIGNIWQFVILHRESKQITQDLNLYRVPNDLETLMKILVALMKNL